MTCLGKGLRDCEIIHDFIIIIVIIISALELNRTVVD